MSHIVFQTSQLSKTLLLKPSLQPPVHPLSGKLRKNLTVVKCSSSSLIDGGDSSVAALERCFSAPPAPVETVSSGSGEVGPVMKGGKYGAFGAVTLEKGKLDLTQKQSTSSPEVGFQNFSKLISKLIKLNLRKGYEVLLKFSLIELNF